MHYTHYCVFMLSYRSHPVRLIDMFLSKYGRTVDMCACFK